MALLADTFASPNSRVAKTVVVVDLTASTSMKAVQPEAQWLTTYGWFFDMLSSSIDKFNGRLVKYMGDGAMAVFSDDHAADAINWAISVQEAMADGRHKNRVSCDCSIGIAFGEVVEFDPERIEEGAVERKDYIGTVVDRAFRLSSAAKAKAIFVDADTVTSALMNRVRSRLGVAKAPARKANEYLGEQELVSLKGFSQPVAYHEILWDSERFGVSTDFVTNQAKAEVPRSIGNDQTGYALAAGWQRGRVSSRNDKFGFIRVAGAEDHYFNADYLFRRDTDVKKDDEVWFIPAPPLADAKSPRAVDVIGLGATLSGKLEKVRSDKGFGFVTSVGQQGDPRQMFVFFGNEGGPWFNGMDVVFKVGENSKGLAGVDPKPLVTK